MSIHHAKNLNQVISFTPSDATTLNFNHKMVHLRSVTSEREKSLRVCVHVCERDRERERERTTCIAYMQVLMKVI